MLSGACIHVKLYYQKDKSLIEYISDPDTNVSELNQTNAAKVTSYISYTNQDSNRVHQLYKNFDGSDKSQENEDIIPLSKIQSEKKDQN